MNAIEFTAVTHDGIIDLPEPYRAAWNRKTLRVICLEPDTGATEAKTVETDDTFGLWRQRVTPADGLEYQERLRTEWPV
jgi:hypothetical protein